MWSVAKGLLLITSVLSLADAMSSFGAPYQDWMKKTIKQESCNSVPLGVENGRVSDSQITASSYYAASLSTRQARLNSATSWSSRTLDANQWLQVSFRRNEIITSIETQGRKTADQWVKTYMVSYSTDGTNFEYYKINRAVMEFSANYDRNSIVNNIFRPPLNARYIRIHPKKFFGHISMRIELYGCPQAPCKRGEIALGMQNGMIGNSQITASSYYRRGLSTSQARLNGPTSWSARRSVVNQWIQVDLGQEQVVTAIATQGRGNAAQWVKTYSVSYSADGKIFRSYKSDDTEKVFAANVNPRSIVTNVFSPPITARYIRIYPKTWFRHMSMRFEVFGCYAGPCKSGGISPLGVERGAIKDSRMTASSFYRAGLAPSKGRLNARDSWSSKRNDLNQWLQVDLGKDELTTAIATQGRGSQNQWVKTYSVSYSSDGTTFKPYTSSGKDKLFIGNADRGTIITHILSPAISARYIRIHPKTWHNHISMRIEIYGCRKEIVSPCKFGEVTLGVADRRIKDAQMTSSSSWSNQYSASRGGRLYAQYAWIPRKTVNQWIQVDLAQDETVTAIATQGRSNANQFVKTYSVSYSTDGKVFKPYEVHGVIKTCEGNSDGNTIVKDNLSPPIRARYVRIYPKTWHAYVSMRIEIYGCYRAPKPCDSKPCRNDGICKNNGASFTCTCPGTFKGNTCEEYASPCGTHEVALGIGSGKIPNSQLTASSSYRAIVGPQRARLNARGGWASRRNDRNQWIQVDLGKDETVTAIATQGRSNLKQWVTSYHLSSSLDGITFAKYKSRNGAVKIFDGNVDRNTIVKHRLPRAITTRYIRIHPVTWFRHISMRFEVYGCYKEPEPCDSSPCKNNAQCTNLGKSFSCKCRPYFIGFTCETELQNPCKSKPCQNGGECVVLGNRYSCRCKPKYGGVNCQYGQSLCYASGDPHYTSFDGLKFNFMGTCEYEFAKDCSGSKPLFNVRTVNQRCGRGVSCTAVVKIYLAGYHVIFTRTRRTAIINGVKTTSYPVVRPGFRITNPSKNWQILATDFGLTVYWDSYMQVRVAVSGRFKGKICPSSLCGNNNGKKHDDNQFSRRCAPPAVICMPDSAKQSLIDKCHLMTAQTSPFNKCNRLVDPTTLINDCKYDACRCEDPMKCVCASFATYSKQCAGYGAVIDWRFEGTYLYAPLRACARQCRYPGQIFTECGSSCAKTCRDLSSDSPCNEQCIPGCQCPKNQVLNENNRCVPITECTCYFQETLYQPGSSVTVGNCKTCTCNAGSMVCVEDRKCNSKGPCESFPCKNGGKCTEHGEDFSCECSDDYQGETCEELKPKPCDAQPCKNDGICTNLEDSFSCECVGNWEGPTCIEPGTPCEPSPCRNGATCIDRGNTFSCKCPPNFIGTKCETELLNPCRNSPCKNQGVCIPLGNGYSCRCPPQYGGDHCEHSQSMCYGQGDPHYKSFDGRKFNFMGRCQYVLAQDCSTSKLFSVYVKNRVCGWGVTCTASVTVYLIGYRVHFNREKRAAVINGVKYTNFPIVKPGFTILNPSLRSLILRADIGLSVVWDSNMNIKVTVSGRHKNKLCASSLCGNNNGNWRDDNQFDRKCAPPPDQEICYPTEQTRATIGKCHLMNYRDSPFKACNAVIDPVQLIANCKYDACRCKDPMQCVCSSFATYSKQCAAYGKVVNWRFEATYLYPPLKKCARQCENEGQIFMECGLSCAQTCSDLSRGLKCNEECVSGCQCPSGEYLNGHNRCVPVAQCPCEYGQKIIKPGESVDVGNCKTCTCSRGSLACVEDRDCQSKGPCESFPCKNQGVCTEKGSSFSCKCSEGYQGETCEKPKPRPCDSSPCKNNGVCTNNRTFFSCECVGDYQGKTCEDKKPNHCEPSPCHNGATCTSTETHFLCKCPRGYIGKLCDKEPPNPCKPNPCKNGAKCKPLGNAFSCRCKDDTYGGPRCEYKQGTCEAHGDPHYTTFDKKKFDFQGPCSYVFSEDCSENKVFKVVTRNQKCGRRGATCTAAVTVHLNGDEITMTREKRTVIINRIKFKDLPIKRAGYVITNPSKNWLRLTADIGLTVQWNSLTIVRVSVAGTYHGKLCGLCGNFNDDPTDDVWKTEPECLPPPTSLFCEHKSAIKNKCFIDKCRYMKLAPFAKCNSVVDPSQFIKDCQYDACKCDDPMDCVCNSFAAYSQQCSNKNIVLQWRSQTTYLLPPLEKCARQCPNPDEIFTECASSCARTCRDLSASLICEEKCIPGCQCRQGKLLNNEGRCVSPAKCPCDFEGNMYEAGENVDAGDCKTCTCNEGAMTCLEDKDCLKKSICDSHPCKNNGSCTSLDDASYTCKCTPEYQGKTCEEPKKQPCDSSPCKNDGICSNEGTSFSCECKSDYEGKTCDELKTKPCDSSPCKNDAICSNEGESFRCECAGIFQGETCEEAKCEETKLDLLLVVDGSGSVRKANFAKVKEFIKKLNARFNIGPGKTQLALMQFGEPVKTRIEFNLNEKTTLPEVNEGVDDMTYLRSQTATGDALRKAREEVFNGKNGDRPDAPNVLLLFTDGQATDKEGKDYQVEQAKKLKEDGVKVITIGMGKKETIEKFRDKLLKMASKASDTAAPLTFQADFLYLDSIANNLVKESCDTATAG